MKRTGTFLLLGHFLALNACVPLNHSPFETKALLSARWIEGDSVLVYSTLTQTGESEKNSVHYLESTVKIFRIEIGANGFFGKTLLHQADTLVPCGDMRYRDSLLFFSYTPLNDKTGDWWGVNCGGNGYGNDGYSNGHTGRLLVGRLGQTPFAPVQGSVDTAALRSILLEYSYNTSDYSLDPGINRNGGLSRPEQFCVNAYCMDP